MKILVTGAGGLVGNGFKSIAHLYPKYDFIFISRKDCDLMDSSAVDKMFDKYLPDMVVHCGARVGGIGRNLNSPAEQFTHNILMNTFVVDSAYRHGVKKLISFSSVCVFPDGAVLTEDNMHDGPPFHAHWSYAMSKRMVDVQLESYRKQYGFEGCSVIPGNIFGEHDNYDLQDGHVIPCLIHKGFLAKKDNMPLSVWGTGKAKREFLYAKDISRVCIELFERDLPQRLIVSGEEEIPIGDIARKIANQYEIDIEWDNTKPDGQHARPSNKNFFRQLFPDFKFTNIDKAIENSVKWFIDNYPNVRGA